MATEPRPVDSHRAANLIEKFRNKKYRNSYVTAHTRRFLARQMRKFRGDKSQMEFGEILGKQQTVVSRLEDPAYGKWTLQTLFDVAQKLDVAVFVRFVDHHTFLRLSEDMSDEASSPLNFTSIEDRKMEELAALVNSRAASHSLQQRSSNGNKSSKADYGVVTQEKPAGIV